MFTSWDQVQSWIEDNNFARWIFYKNNPEGREEKAAADIIIDSKNFTVSDLHDKLAMTEKYIRMYGAKVYGVGYQSPEYTRNGVYCEVRLTEDAQAQGASGIGGSWQEQIGAMRESITREIRAEMEAQRYKDERAQFEKERKEFEEEKKSAIGALTHYLAPLGQMILQKKMGMPMVAGLDTNAPVHAQPIIPDRKPADAPEGDPATQELVDEANNFTDEEEEKLYDLLSRFKKVEPQYLELIEAVVTMAESGNSMYATAKGWLIK